MPLQFDRVQAKKLVKVYGATRALAGVNLTFEARQVTVVLGPNGSGKSTLLSILAHLAKPTRGAVYYGKIDGRRAGAAVRSRIGVLGHAAMVYPDLTGRENLELFAALYDISEPKKRVEALVQRFEIGPFFERPTRTYSRGQLQRVALARAVLHRPDLLLLDEPSTGLDTRAVERLITAVKQERDEGTIQVLVTHDEHLAEAVGDRMIRLDRGRVVESYEPETRGADA